MIKAGKWMDAIHLPAFLRSMAYIAGMSVLEHKLLAIGVDRDRMLAVNPLRQNIL